MPRLMAGWRRLVRACSTVSSATSAIDNPFHRVGEDALGPGERAWMTLEPGEPGDHVVVCFIPGRDDIPHLAKGMFHEFTVG